MHSTETMITDFTVQGILTQVFSKKAIKVFDTYIYNQSFIFYLVNLLECARMQARKKIYLKSEQRSLT